MAFEQGPMRSIEATPRKSRGCPWELGSAGLASWGGELGLYSEFSGRSLLHLGISVQHTGLPVGMMVILTLQRQTQNQRS